MDIIAENLFLLPQLISEAESAQLIARGEALGFESSSVTTEQGPKMMQAVRNNDRVILDDAHLAKDLWDRIRQFVPSELGTSKAHGLNERFRFYRYDPTQRFKAHRDGSYRRSATVASRLTFMIYLNAGFRGGETKFYSEDRVDGMRRRIASIEPVTGTGLVFAHEWWHEGATVETGRKYVLRTDIMFAEKAW